MSETSGFTIVDYGDRLAYLDGSSDLDLTVYATGSQVQLLPDQSKLVAQAIGFDLIGDQQFPKRVVCSNGGCDMCAEPRCVPPKTLMPVPPAPLGNSGLLPTPMVLSGTLAYSSGAIVAEDGTRIQVFDLDPSALEDAVKQALTSRIGTQDPPVYFHVYVVAPSDTSPPPQLEFLPNMAKVFAIPVELTVP